MEKYDSAAFETVCCVAEISEGEGHMFAGAEVRVAVDG